jgi:hypothetical protein
MLEGWGSSAVYHAGFIRRMLYWCVCVFGARTPPEHEYCILDYSFNLPSPASLKTPGPALYVRGATMYYSSKGRVRARDERLRRERGEKRLINSSWDRRGEKFACQFIREPRCKSDLANYRREVSHPTRHCACRLHDFLQCDAAAAAAVFINETAHSSN